MLQLEYIFNKAVNSSSSLVVCKLCSMHCKNFSYMVAYEKLKLQICNLSLIANKHDYANKCFCVFENYSPSFGNIIIVCFCWSDLENYKNMTFHNIFLQMLLWITYNYLFSIKHHECHQSCLIKDISNSNVSYFHVINQHMYWYFDYLTRVDCYLLCNK